MHSVCFSPFCGNTQSIFVWWIVYSTCTISVSEVRAKSNFQQLLLPLLLLFARCIRFFILYFKSAPNKDAPNAIVYAHLIDGRHEHNAEVCVCVRVCLMGLEIFMNLSNWKVRCVAQLKHSLGSVSAIALRVFLFQCGRALLSQEPREGRHSA